MKIKNLITATLLLSGMAACKKEHTDAIQTVSNKKLIRVEDAEYPVNNTSFTYDAAGRLTSLESPDYVKTYTFTAGQVEYKRFLKAQGRNDYAATLKLNANGFITTADVVYYPTANTPTPSQHTYEYNGEGNVIKKTISYSANNTGVYLNEFTNGNLTKQTYSSNGAVTGSWKYTYGNVADKTGMSDQFSDYNNFHLGGIANKNLVTKAEQFDAANIKIFEIQYEYTMDKDGYPVQLTSHYITNNKDYHTTYIYNK